MANVLWFVLVGWWLALEHLIVGILLCTTVIGIPLGVGSFKMAGAALVPFGKEVVELRTLAKPPEDAVVIGAETDRSPNRARQRPALRASCSGRS